MPPTADLPIWAIALASIFLVLWRPGGWSEAWWASGGALLIVLAKLLPISEAGRAIAGGFQVYLFLAGMMLLSELARVTGVFDWIAEVAADFAAGSTRRLFLLIYLAGVVVTAFLSNDATAVVLTPAVLAIVRRVGVEPRPHLLSCALVSNAASFLLPISNPANLVIFGHHLPPLATWLASFFLPSVAAIVVTYGVLRIYFARTLRIDIRRAVVRQPISLKGRLSVAGLGLAAAGLMLASARGWDLGTPSLAAALLAIGLVAFREKRLAVVVFRGVAWTVFPLVAGLFVIVAALERTGALRLALEGLHAAAQMPRVAADCLTGFSVGLLSNGMNNLPVGLLAGTALQASPPAAHLSQAVLIGVDLGPNLSVTGSLATILWLIVLRRENVSITGWQFLQVGLIAMPLALVTSLLLLR